MPVTYRLIGFKDYIIINKILYREKYVTAKKQYRNKRKINRTFKDGCIGYWLVKAGKRKFYPLKKLKHKLKKINE